MAKKRASRARKPKARTATERPQTARSAKARRPEPAQKSPGPPAAPKARLPRPASAEMLLLELAKELAVLARDAEPARALSMPLQRLADAYGPSESLPHEVYRAWVRSRGDKTAALALSWAREQVRLGLQDVVERAKGAKSRVELDSETFAWLLLAGCEAISQEPPSAVPDRVRALTQLIGPVAG